MENSKTPTRDKIHLRNLRLRCIIGFNDWEREKKQDVLVNLTIHTDLAKPAATDDKEDTLDYKVVKDHIVDLVEASSFNLIERLADAIATKCLEFQAVQQVTVTVDKPGALRYADSVAVEITRP